jgi:hypothetical protein
MRSKCEDIQGGVSGFEKTAMKLGKGLQAMLPGFQASRSWNVAKASRLCYREVKSGVDGSEKSCFLGTWPIIR